MTTAKSRLAELYVIVCEGMDDYYVRFGHDKAIAFCKQQSKKNVGSNWRIFKWTGESFYIPTTRANIKKTVAGISDTRHVIPNIYPIQNKKED